MKLGYSPNGEAFVAGYDPGDMVMLVGPEPGTLGQGRFGDWGRVKSVDSAGMLTITIAGYSLPRGASLAMLSDIPARRVKPCTPKGEVLILPHQVQPQTLWTNARPVGGGRRQRP